jgi:hypothetical protein
MRDELFEGPKAEIAAPPRLLASTQYALRGKIQYLDLHDFRHHWSHRKQHQKRLRGAAPPAN